MVKRDAGIGAPAVSTKRAVFALLSLFIRKQAPSSKNGLPIFLLKAFDKADKTNYNRKKAMKRKRRIDCSFQRGELAAERLFKE